MENELITKLEKIEQRLNEIEKQMTEQKLLLDMIYSFFRFDTNSKNNKNFLRTIYITFILGNISGLISIAVIIRLLIKTVLGK